MKSMRTNSGMSSLGLLMLLVVVVFLGTFAFRVVPMYYSHYMLEQTIANLDQPGAALNGMTVSEMRESLNKSLQINGINLDAREIEIQKTNNLTTLKYSYEKNAPLFFNIGIVGNFSLEYVSGN